MVFQQNKGGTLLLQPYFVLAMKRVHPEQDSSMATCCLVIGAISLSLE
jgi:hypothetical protein